MWTKHVTMLISKTTLKRFGAVQIEREFDLTCCCLLRLSKWAELLVSWREVNSKTFSASIGLRSICWCCWKKKIPKTIVTKQIRNWFAYTSIFVHSKPIVKKRHNWHSTLSRIPGNAQPWYDEKSRARKSEVLKPISVRNWLPQQKEHTHLVKNSDHCPCTSAAGM